MIFREITSLLGKWTVSYMRNRSGVMVCVGLNGCFFLETTLQMKPLTILTRFGVDGGKSVATTMGLTPLDGVIMGTRCGSIDPAIITFLMGKGMAAQEVDTLINKKSGVQGISGVSSDFRDLAAAAAESFAVGEGRRRNK